MDIRPQARMQTSCVTNPKDLTRSIFCFRNALLCIALCECLRLSVSSTMLFCRFLVLNKGSWPRVVWVDYSCSIRGHQTWSWVGCFPYAAYFCCSHRLHQMKQQVKILVFSFSNFCLYKIQFSSLWMNLTSSLLFFQEISTEFVVMGKDYYLG